MRLGFVAQRLEFLSAGEVLGWPRLAYAPGRFIKAGQGNWENFARGPIQRVMPALRNAKIRRDNLGGQLESQLNRVQTMDTVARFGSEVRVLERPAVKKPYSTEQRRENLAKARAVRAARRASAS